MRNSAQRKSPNEFICVDYVQGRWRVSIGEHVFMETVESKVVFQFAGKLAKKEGLGVAFYLQELEDEASN
ncbi:MAG: hypothetical protein DKT66_28305 [Candidatus Melainabacteria bacterium]|jgi:hypothetical protein|nr:MAG: hypothetical protein DKT66_28305 [Candidatus Melainabacteria bacterium]